MVFAAFETHSGAGVRRGRPGREFGSDVYDRIADVYRTQHRRFLNWTGGKGQAALSGAIVSLLEPNMLVLDAGCGNGDLGREILATESDCEVEFLDAAVQMLRQVPGGLGKKTLASIMEIPSRSSAYDLTICSFVLECLDKPEEAVGELARVTKSGGHICLAFCAESSKPGLPTRLIRLCMALRKTGRFLDKNRIVSALARLGVCNVREVFHTGSVCVLIAHK